MSVNIEQLNIDQLTQSVQRNCDISDAQFAGNYTICIYLLKMREFYRWEKGLPYTASLPKADIGAWLTAKESLWDELADAQYDHLHLGDEKYDPFATEPINQVLLDAGFIYSGGIGPRGQPLFFLGRLHRLERYKDYQLMVSDDDLARDLTAPPAFSHDKNIFIRRQSLRRMIWERIEEWQWNQVNKALGRALEYYPWQTELDKALDQITDVELDNVLLHEIGEIRAGEILGDTWHEMLAALPRSRAEFVARAVRDHLADCLSTLPGLLEKNNPASLHFYFGNLHGMRKEIFPALNTAYQDWVETGRVDRLQEVIRQGAEHWQEVAENMMTIYREQQDNCESALSAYADDIKL